MANADVKTGTTYAGKRARPYVAPAILAADSIAGNYISVLQNVRFKSVLRKFNGAAISPASCTFTTPTSGALDIDDVVLTTEQFQVNEQICNKDLREAWEAENMSGSNSAAPNELKTFAAQYVAARVAESVEKNLWHGDYNEATGATTGGSASTLYGGIMAKIVAASPTYETAAAGAFTADADATTGILTHLAALTADAPPAIAGDPNANIYMSRQAVQLYYKALAATYNQPFLNDGLVSRYAGYNIVSPAGMPNDTLLLSRPDNLYFGTDLLTDHISANLLDLNGVTGDDVTRIILRFSAGTQVVDHNSYAVVRRTS